MSFSRTATPLDFASSDEAERAPAAPSQAELYLEKGLDIVATRVMDTGNWARTAWNSAFKKAAEKLHGTADNAFTRATLDHYTERVAMLAMQRTQLKAGSAEDGIGGVKKAIGGLSTYGTTVRTMGYTAAAFGAIPLALPALALISKTGASIANIAFKTATDDTRNMAAEDREARYAEAIVEKRGARGVLNSMVRMVDSNLQNFESYISKKGFSKEWQRKMALAAAALAKKQRAELQMCAGTEGMRLGALSAYGLNSVFTAGSTAFTALLSADMMTGHHMSSYIGDQTQELAEQTRSLVAEATDTISATRAAIADNIILSDFSLTNSAYGATLPAMGAGEHDLGSFDPLPPNEHNLGDFAAAPALVAEHNIGSFDAVGEHNVGEFTAAPALVAEHNLGAFEAVGEHNVGAFAGEPAATAGFDDTEKIEAWATGRGSISQLARALATEHDTLHDAASFRHAMSHATFNGVKDVNLWEKNDVIAGDTVRIVGSGANARFEVTTQGYEPAQAAAAVTPAPSPVVSAAVPCEETTLETAAATPTAPADAPATTTTVAAAPAAEPIATAPANGEVHVTQVNGETFVRQHSSLHEVKNVDVYPGRDFVRVERTVNGGAPIVEEFRFKGNSFSLPSTTLSQSHSFTLRNGEVVIGAPAAGHVVETPTEPVVESAKPVEVKAAEAKPVETPKPVEVKEVPKAAAPKVVATAPAKPVATPAAATEPVTSGTTAQSTTTVRPSATGGVRIEQRTDGGAPVVTETKGTTATATVNKTATSNVVVPDASAAQAAPVPAATQGTVVPQGSVLKPQMAAELPKEPARVDRPTPAPVETIQKPVATKVVADSFSQFGEPQVRSLWDVIRANPATVDQLRAYEERLGANGTTGEITNTALLDMFKKEGVQNGDGTSTQLFELLTPDELTVMQEGFVSLLRRATMDDLRTPASAAAFVARELRN